MDPVRSIGSSARVLWIETFHVSVMVGKLLKGFVHICSKTQYALPFPLLHWFGICWKSQSYSCSDLVVLCPSLWCDSACPKHLSLGRHCLWWIRSKHQIIDVTNTYKEDQVRPCKTIYSWLSKTHINMSSNHQIPASICFRTGFCELQWRNSTRLQGLHHSHEWRSRPGTASPSELQCFTATGPQQITGHHWSAKDRTALTPASKTRNTWEQRRWMEMPNPSKAIRKDEGSQLSGWPLLFIQGRSEEIK